MSLQWPVVAQAQRWMQPTPKTASLRLWVAAVRGSRLARDWRGGCVLPGERVPEHEANEGPLRGDETAPQVDCGWTDRQTMLQQRMRLQCVLEQVVALSLRVRLESMLASCTRSGRRNRGGQLKHELASGVMSQRLLESGWTVAAGESESGGRREGAHPPYRNQRRSLPDCPRSLSSLLPPRPPLTCSNVCCCNPAPIHAAAGGEGRSMGESRGICRRQTQMEGNDEHRGWRPCISATFERVRRWRMPAPQFPLLRRTDHNQILATPQSPHASAATSCLARVLLARRSAASMSWSQRFLGHRISLAVFPASTRGGHRAWQRTCLEVYITASVPLTLSALPRCGFVCERVSRVCCLGR